MPSESKQAVCVSLETRRSDRAFGASTGKAQDRQIPYHFFCGKMRRVLPIDRPRFIYVSRTVHPSTSAGWALYVQVVCHGRYNSRGKDGAQGTTMDAAVLHPVGKPPRCEQFPEPVAGYKEVIVHVHVEQQQMHPQQAWPTGRVEGGS